MSQKKSAKIQHHFANLSDPRRRKVTYPLMNIVVIAVCAVICGADDFVAIADFGKTKRKWFARFLDLRSGIPSHDRFNAVLAAIKPAEFEQCLLSWITALHEITAGQVVDFSILRRTALAMLKNESTLKVGVKNKRLSAGWNEAYLEQVLIGM